MIARRLAVRANYIDEMMRRRRKIDITSVGDMFLVVISDCYLGRGKTVRQAFLRATADINKAKKTVWMR